MFVLIFIIIFIILKSGTVDEVSTMYYNSPRYGIIRVL